MAHHHAQHKIRHLWKHAAQLDPDIQGAIFIVGLAVVALVCSIGTLIYTGAL